MPEFDWDIRKHVREHVRAIGGQVLAYHDDGWYRVMVILPAMTHVFYGSLPRNAQQAWELAWHFVRYIEPVTSRCGEPAAHNDPLDTTHVCPDHRRTAHDAASIPE